MEFKNSAAAEQCVMENNGAKVIDGILQLTYAIPGYSGVDFVWNKPANIHFKRSQVFQFSSFRYEKLIKSFLFRDESTIHAFVMDTVYVFIMDTVGIIMPFL